MAGQTHLGGAVGAAEVGVGAGAEVGVGAFVIQGCKGRGGRVYIRHCPGTDREKPWHDA